MKPKTKKIIARVYIIVSWVLILSYIISNKICEFDWNLPASLQKILTAISDFPFSIIGKLGQILDVWNVTHFFMLSPIVFFILSLYFIIARYEDKKRGHPVQLYTGLAITSIFNWLLLFWMLLLLSAGV